jgi:hypothetical protein
MLFQRGPAYGSLTTAGLQGPALTSETCPSHQKA